MAIIHLNQILTFQAGTHMMSAWRHPHHSQPVGLTSSSYWAHLARVLEKGGFDNVFFADVLSVSDSFADAARISITKAAAIPKQDPFALIPIMAEVTSHLGFAVTLSTAGTPPFLAVRRLGTLDNLSGGRIGWNVVTSVSAADYRALGLEQPAHDARYDQADEYVDLCYQLWDSFPRNAVKFDKIEGVATDFDRIKRVEFSGKFYQCSAYPVVPQSPQGRPMIFQAGQSGRGIEFAAKHAEAIYSLQARAEGMARYMDQIKSASVQAARTPRVFFGIQPILGATEVEARSKLEGFRQNVPIEAALNNLSMVFGRKFDKSQLDLPLSNFETEASRGILDNFLDSAEGRVPTVREAAVHWGTSIGMAQKAGTPEQIAAWIEDLWRRTGCYGFGISPNVNPGSIEDFVDHVVPLLRKKGLVRTEYQGTTLRENLAQSDPSRNK